MCKNSCQIGILYQTLEVNIAPQGRAHPHFRGDETAHGAQLMHYRARF